MAEMKQTIEFTKDHEVQDHRAGTKEAEKYVAGKRYKLAPASALHFARLDVARILSDEKDA